jgi:acyl dehydratase
VTAADDRRTYFDDLQVGVPIEIGTYVVSKDDAIAFATTWEPQPYHVDEAAAAASIFGGLTLCSLHLFAIVTRLFFDYERPFAVSAMLGKDEVRLPRPARPDEELTYTTTCIETRPSKSRPGTGIVTLQDTLSSSDGEPVLTQKVTLLMQARPA